jgi:hypothetical protein
MTDKIGLDVPTQGNYGILYLVHHPTGQIVIKSMPEPLMLCLIQIPVDQLLKVNGI